MRLLGVLLVACVVLAAAQAVATALALLAVLAFLCALIVSPGEVLALVGLCMLAELVERQPLAFLALLTLLATFKAIADRK